MVSTEGPTSALIEKSTLISQGAEAASLSLQTTLTELRANDETRS
jgi:hypothetical protein